jgi:TonB family protein
MSDAVQSKSPAEAGIERSGSGAGLLAPAIDFTAPLGLPRPVQRRNWLLSISAAVLTHIALLYALWPWAEDSTGVGGGDLAGIEVDIVTVAAIDETIPSSRERGTGGEVATYGRPGDVSALADQAASNEAEDRHRETPQPEPSPETVEPSPLAEPQSPQSDASSAATRSAELSYAGGASAPGSPASSLSVGSGEGLSPGIVQRYKGEIIQRLAARKPTIGVHVQGEVVIEFTIIDTGEVREARVASSSGQKLLDDAALSAVQSTRFPAPPPGMSRALLTYRVPYYFRPPVKR